MVISRGNEQLRATFHGESREGCIGIFSRGCSGKERGKENKIAEYNFCRVPLTSRKLISSSVEKKIFSLIRFELYIYLRKLN